MQRVVSIIVPVFNVEKFLYRCVDSIIHQTYQQLDIVLVDDGSTDRSGMLCDEYAKADSRIKAIHKENGGASSARNIGLENISGDYVAFVDSDDFLHPRFCERLMEYAKKYRADIVQCDIYKGTADRFPELKQNKSICPTVASGRETLLSNLYKVSIWAKLYSSEIVSRFRFQEGIIYEDDDIYYKYGYAAHRICLAPDKLYYYYQSPNSVMHKRSKQQGLDMISRIYESRIDYFLAFDDQQMVSRSIERYCITLMLLYMENNAKHPCRQEQKELFKTFCEKYARIHFDKVVSKRTQFLFLMFRMFPNFSSYITNGLNLRN